MLLVLGLLYQAYQSNNQKKCRQVHGLSSTASKTAVQERGHFGRVPNVRGVITHYRETLLPPWKSISDT